MGHATWEVGSMSMPGTSFQGADRPSRVTPCPSCGGRLTMRSVRPSMFVGTSDVTHGCQNCGTELIRTLVRDKAAG
jgi:hypothetical protein